MYEENDHCGVGLTIAQVRQKYYISALQQRAKKWIRVCAKCIRFNGQSPRMADLPTERVSPRLVFENTYDLVMEQTW